MANMHYVDTYVDGQHVDKDDVRDSFRDYVGHYYTVSEVQALTTGGARFISIAGRPYVLDAADTTTADDGIDTIVSADGKRYKSVSWSYALRVPDGTAALPGVRFGSDPDNGIYRSGTNLWHLVGGGVAIASINASGLGLGTSPGYPLDVYGRVRFGSSFAASGTPSFDLTSPAITSAGVGITQRMYLPNKSVTSNEANYFIGLDVQTTAPTVSAGVTDSGYRMGLRFDALLVGAGFAGSMGSLYGISSSAGLYTNVASTASVTNVFGNRLNLYTGVVGSVITNLYGLYLDTVGSGTVTNPWGVYVNSASLKNYFAGDVGVGKTPGCKLDVEGVIRPRTYTVGTLPAVVAGGLLYVSDGRKNGEGAGFGTGVLVFGDGSAWRAVDTGATVAA